MLLRGILLFFFLFHQETTGCHSGVDDSHNRRRRQTNVEGIFSAQVEATRSLRDYFAACVQDKAGGNLQGAVDYTILDTLWYQTTDTDSCSSEDSVRCWTERLNIYLRQTSSLLGPTNECIQQYSMDISDGIFVYTSRRKRQVSKDGDEDILLTSYVTCLNRTLILPRNRRNLDLLEVVNFVEQHAICGECDKGRGSEFITDLTEDEFEDSFVELSNSRQEVANILSQNTISARPRERTETGCRSSVLYPFLLSSLTKTDSPLFQTITPCNALYSEIFLPNPCGTLQNSQPDTFCIRQQSWCNTVDQFSELHCQKTCCEKNADVLTDAPTPGWTTWSPWGICPARCFQTAVQQRERSCSLGVPNIYPCIGSSTENRVCNSSLICPTWTEWGSWSSCAKTCGQSSRSSFRRCLNRDCPGLSNRNMPCNNGICYGFFSSWSQWTLCSLTCGSGRQRRNRKCVEGATCRPDQHGDVTSQQQSCNVFTCPGIWSTWSQWSACGVTCGGIGTQQVRQRSCTGSGQCSGQNLESQPCGNIPCPVPMWADWSTWSDCTWQRRTRVCVGGEVGSGTCQGDVSEFNECSGTSCNVSGRDFATRWSNWGRCSQTCGIGFRIRNRTCVASFGRVVCPNSRPNIQRCRNVLQC